MKTMMHAGASHHTWKIALGACLAFGFMLRAAAADKHERLIGLYDVAVHFQDPAIDWQQVSDAFVQQLLADDGGGGCIKVAYLPQRFLGNQTPQSHVGFDGTAGLDYVIFGDLYKDDQGFRMEAYMVTGKSRLTVLKTVLPAFTDPKEAGWKAKMAALNLRSDAKGSRSLADCIFDFEKKQRAARPRDVAIAPEFKVDGQDSVTKMKAGESRKFSLSLIDCDGVPLEGAEVTMEVAQGIVKPATVTIQGGGTGEFTYEAPKEDCDVQVRAAFPYFRGSEHPGMPSEVRFVEIQVGKVAAWNGSITYRLAGSATGRNDNGNTYPSQLDETATYIGVFKPDSSGEAAPAWRVVSGDATAKINDDLMEVSQGGSQRTANTGRDSVNLPAGSFRLVFAEDGSSYSIEFGQVMFKMQYTIYEVDEPQTVWQEASELHWFVPPLTIKDIPMPKEGESLKGSRKVAVPVNLVGIVVPVDSVISWNFEPIKAASPGQR